MFVSNTQLHIYISTIAYPLYLNLFFISMQLFQLASYCSVVLCCRVAPLQKAGIVALIKNRTDDMTLAIGDGKC